ncbi:hypothetical protein E5K00_05755 [Hymenobacter aquaticus]|uniref:Uncharacterized protein n=1 Tax=Hymenobacter aquaticus TaxID=1867101 RepID=A0A4Z0Q530_9BACT|nr:hypothetical protein [Hymenobacter aquaticus]TGE24714.1 hypothetical protein E5K00_05755 [Hymenobacter aquaticus]
MQKYTSVEDQVLYGLDKIDRDRKVEISLYDLVFVVKTIEELNRFFHQPMHYTSSEDVVEYLGTVNSGAFSLIHKMNYGMLHKYLPEDIKNQMGWETDELVNPNPPYYFKPKE